MEFGFYWYFEQGFSPTVVSVDEEGIQFPGNDDIFQIEGVAVDPSLTLRGKFVGPLVPPAI